MEIIRTYDSVEEFTRVARAPNSCGFVRASRENPPSPKWDFGAGMEGALRLVEAGLGRGRESSNVQGLGRWFGRQGESPRESIRTRPGPSGALWEAFERGFAVQKSSRDYDSPDAHVKFRCVGCGKKYIDEAIWIVGELPVHPKTTMVVSLHGACRACNPSGKVLTRAEIDRIPRLVKRRRR